MKIFVICMSIFLRRTQRYSFGVIPPRKVVVQLLLLALLLEEKNAKYLLMSLKLPQSEQPSMSVINKKWRVYIEEIYEELQEAHMDDYTPEQLRAWAHLIQMNKHDSYEEPPNKPFFRNTHKPKSKRDDLLLSDCKTLSPGKDLSIQTELIEQIAKLHA